MAKRRREWDMRTFIRLLSEGRGQGTGKDYIPFVMIHDIPSKGICTRVTGTTVGRVHHLLSRNELAFFYILDYDTAVVDIREQFPLLDMDDPLDLVPVVELAESLGIIYPRDPVSRFPYVMTSDFLVTYADGTERAFSIKESKEFSKKRVRELQQLERSYWENRNVRWSIRTEKSGINFDMARNIQWIYRAKDIDILFPEKHVRRATMEYELERYLTSHVPICEIAHEAEKRYFLNPGCGMTAFQRLLFEHRLEIPLDKPLDLFAYRLQDTEGGAYIWQD